MRIYDRPHQLIYHFCIIQANTFLKRDCGILALYFCYTDVIVHRVVVSEKTSLERSRTRFCDTEKFKTVSLFRLVGPSSSKQRIQNLPNLSVVQSG